MDENEGGIFVMVNRTTICVVESDVFSDSESGHYAIGILSVQCKLGVGTISVERPGAGSNFRSL
jgi:hypothetical protein